MLMSWEEGSEVCKLLYPQQTPHTRTLESQCPEVAGLYQKHGYTWLHGYTPSYSFTDQAALFKLSKHALTYVLQLMSMLVSLD